LVTVPQALLESASTLAASTMAWRPILFVRVTVDFIVVRSGARLFIGSLSCEVRFVRYQRTVSSATVRD
jgi:hypothetical protein